MVLLPYLRDFVIQISPTIRAATMKDHGGVLSNKDVSILMKEEFSKNPLDGIKFIDVKTVRMIIGLPPRVCLDGLMQFSAFVPARDSLTIGSILSI